MGNSSFIRVGLKPRVNIIKPEDLKDIFTKFGDFRMLNINSFVKLLGRDLVRYKVEKWAKHQQIFNLDFHLKKSKVFIIMLTLRS